MYFLLLIYVFFSSPREKRFCLSVLLCSTVTLSDNTSPSAFLNLSSLLKLLPLLHILCAFLELIIFILLTIHWFFPLPFRPIVSTVILISSFFFFLFPQNLKVYPVLFILSPLYHFYATNRGPLRKCPLPITIDPTHTQHVHLPVLHSLFGLPVSQHLCSIFKILFLHKAHSPASSSYLFSFRLTLPKKRPTRHTNSPPGCSLAEQVCSFVIYL